MRSPGTLLAAVGLAAILLVAGGAMAVVNMETVPVGDPGNAADARYADPNQYYLANGIGYGAVSYAYNIGKYEVTAGQYTAFLNAVGGVDTYSLYTPNIWGTDIGNGITQSGDGTVGNPYTYSVATDFANRPVNYVSYWDACRFANWLNNGQPTGAGGLVQPRPAPTRSTGTTELWPEHPAQPRRNVGGDE